MKNTHPAFDVVTQQNIALKILAVIKEKEWIRGNLYKRDEKRNVVGCCMLGAWLIGAPTDPVGPCFHDFVREKGFHGISDLNDDFIKSKEEAIAFFEEYIAAIPRLLEKK